MRTKRGIVTILGLTGLLLAACGGSSDLAWEHYDRTYGSDAGMDGYVWAAGAGFANAAGAGTVAGDLDGLVNGDGVVSAFCFDTGGISDDAVIESAVLRVFQENVVGAPYTTLGDLVVDHVQLGADLDVADYDGGTIVSNIGTLSSTTTLEWKTLDVTAAVQSDVTAGRPRSEFRIRFSVASDSDSSNDNMWANDAEDTRASGHLPQLVVSYRAPRL